MALRWYVVHAYSNFENKVKTSLEERIKLKGLQDKFGIRAGYLQLGIDAVILAAAFIVVPVDRAILSLLGALVLNMIVGLNHKPGRYVGFS